MDCYRQAIGHMEVRPIRWNKTQFFPGSGRVHTTQRMLTKRIEKKLDGMRTRMLQAVLNKSGKQHLTKQQLYGHLPLISEAIRVRRTRHAKHSDVLLWTPSHGRASVGRPARTYLQQLCANTVCSQEELLKAIDERAEWRGRVWETILEAQHAAAADIFK